MPESPRSFLSSPSVRRTTMGLTAAAAILLASCNKLKGVAETINGTEEDMIGCRTTAAEIKQHPEIGCVARVREAIGQCDRTLMRVGKGMPSVASRDDSAGIEKSDEVGEHLQKIADRKATLEKACAKP